MKRSEINEILGHTRQFFSMHDVHLPPFASFPQPNGISLITIAGAKSST
jgi:D-lyxose ketol-isomerase